MGVQPEVVKVLPPKMRLGEWEREQRRRIQEAVAQEAVVPIVVSDDLLLYAILGQIRADASRAPGSRRSLIAANLLMTAKVLSPEAVDRYRPMAQVGQKRSADDWAEILDELSALLANGQFYKRDLPTIDGPLARVVEHFLRRREQ